MPWEPVADKHFETLDLLRPNDENHPQQSFLPLPGKAFLAILLLRPLGRKIHA
jgi:hypothetical protein